MAAARSPDFDLRAALESAGFTPRGSDAAAIVALLVADAEVAKGAERALVALGRGALPALRGAAGTADVGARARVTGAFGRVALALGDAALYDELAAALGDAESRVRRAAERALGKSGERRFATALAARLRGADDAERRVLVEALGKLGAGDALAGLEAGGDAVLAAKLDDARRRSRRDVLRDGDATRIDAAAKLPVACDAWLACKEGLEEVLASECGELGLEVTEEAPGRVVVRLPAGASLGVLREPRCAEDAALVAGALRDADAFDVADLLAGSGTRSLLRALTSGPIRFRLAWPSGHGRARTREVACILAERAPELVDDPKASPWEAHVADGVLLLVPHALADDRFAATPARVPASSHPSVAAALARLAGARPDDVVWDPFCGAALELCEHARLGPARLRVGTDTDARAIAGARANAAGARVRLELAVADARRYAPPAPPTLFLTNPPLGHRTLRGDALLALLEEVLTHAARVMGPSARLLWLTPHEEFTGRVLAELGFDVEDGPRVDLGGVVARLQRAVFTGGGTRRPRPAG